MNADSVITVKSSSGWKFKIALGAIGLVVITILAFMFQWQVGIVVLVSGLGGSVLIWNKALHQVKISQYERRQLEAQTAEMESKAVKAKAESYFVETNSGVFVLQGIAIDRFYPAVSASKALGELPLLPAETEQTKYRKLLDVDFVHLLIVGPTNSGKTTVANWLIDNSNAVVYVCDPHSKYNVWSARVSQVVGNGRDYQAIDSTLSSLLGEMHKRYQSNETNFTKILIVVDEWLSVKEHCENAEQFFNVIGSESRKVNMSLIITTISATVDDLNCSAAVRDNLTQLSLNRTLKAQNLGELRHSKRDTESVELPGAYHQALPARVENLPVKEEEESPISYDAGPTIYSPNANELKCYELFLKGESYRSISREVFGSVGGRQVEEIKEILSKFGVS